MLHGNRNTMQQTNVIGFGSTKLSSDGWKHSIQATYLMLHVDNKERL